MTRKSLIAAAEASDKHTTTKRGWITAIKTARGTIVYVAVDGRAGYVEDTFNDRLTVKAAAKLLGLGGAA